MLVLVGQPGAGLVQAVELRQVTRLFGQISVDLAEGQKSLSFAPIESRLESSVTLSHPETSRTLLPAADRVRLT